MRRPLLFVALALCLLAAGGLAAAFTLGVHRGSGDEQGFLARLISRALSTPTNRVHIGGVEGALSSDAIIRDVALSDGNGVWLRVDRVRIRWRRAALLMRRLEVDRLEIGHFEIRRRPLPKAKTEVVKDADKPILPDLPVKVEIKRFEMANLDLGAPVLGIAVRATATGDTALGSPAEGLSFHLDGQRLDSPGHFLAALTYTPGAQALAVNIALDEPAGGLVSRLAHLPAAPPVKLDIAGDGTLDSFRGHIDFIAGPAIDAKGAVTLARSGAGRLLSTRVAGHLGAMLPGPAAPIFEGETSLASDLRFADDGGLSLDNAALVSHLARLDAHGTLSPDKAVDIVTTIRAVPNQGETSTLGGASIRTLVFDGTVKGAVATPRIEARLALADAKLPDLALGRIDASFSALPSGAIADATTRITLDGKVEASDIAPRNRDLDRAIGGSATLALHGTTDVNGDAIFDRLEAKTPTATLGYAGALSGKHVHGRLDATVPELGRFGDLGARPLAGNVAVTADVDGDPSAKVFAVALDGRTSGLATGSQQADGLLGRTVSLKGHLATAKDGGRIDELAIDGAHASVRVSGALAAATSDLAAKIMLPDLAAADPRLAGTAQLDAALTGGTDKPTVKLTATIDAARALGRAIPHLALDVDGRGLRSAPSVLAKLDGLVDGKPARGRFDLAAMPTAGGWALHALDVAIGSVAVHGAGTLDAARHADGRLTLAAADLDDISALALTRLGGRFELAAKLSTQDGRQDAHVKANGAVLSGFGASLRRLALRFDGQDLLGHPVVNGDASIDEASVAGQTITGVAFAARGDATRSAMTLRAKAAGFDLDAAGDLVPGAASRFDLARFSARRGARRIALAQPAQFVLADGGVDIRRFALSVAGGRITVGGHAGERLDLSAEAKAVPLAAADIALPGLGLGGTLDASARIGGRAAAPEGNYRLDIRKLAAPQTRQAGLPAIDITAQGRLDGHRATLDAKATAGRAGALTAAGSLPLAPAGALDLQVRGRLDAALANATLGPSGRTVSGVLTIDAKVAGTTAAPKMSGGVAMAGGTFRDTLLGVRLDAIALKAVAQGDHVTIERLAASTPNGGTLSGSGDVRIAPDAGFPGRIALRGHGASLSAPGLMDATADLAIDVSGPLARAPRIGGRIDLTHVDVGIPDRLPSALKPIDGITHVNAPDNAAARLALMQKKTKAADGRKSRAALFDATLDVTVAAPSRIFVRGRGMDAELGGDLRVTGTTNHPRPGGAFALRSGKLVALGKTLTFTKGKLTFTGDFVPEVDFAAEIAANGLTAQIAVTGPAAAPAFAFTSTPTLPQDEILSRVLFNKSSGNLSGFQALQLAQTAAQFSSGGDGAFEKLRRSLGVDSLDIGTGTRGSPSVGVSRAIGDRLSVGVRTGATADETGLSADVDVTRHMRVQSDVRSNGSTSVGVGSEFEY